MPVFDCVLRTVCIFKVDSLLKHSRSDVLMTSKTKQEGVKTEIHTTDSAETPWLDRRIKRVGPT